MEFRVFIEPDRGRRMPRSSPSRGRRRSAASLRSSAQTTCWSWGDGDDLPGPTDTWTRLAGPARDTNTIRLGTLEQLAIIIRLWCHESMGSGAKQFQIRQSGLPAEGAAAFAVIASTAPVVAAPGTTRSWQGGSGRSFRPNRKLAMEAAEEHLSLNRYVLRRLTNAS